MKQLHRHWIIFALILLSDALKAQPTSKLLPFQGRLTDQNGSAVQDGARLIQFKIYDVSTGGTPVWAGELHRTTVNGGLVNVLLGSKAPFSGVDFDRQLYLEITVDTSGPNGVPDNAITAADPPMLPRQAILPVVFAKESADSRLLEGQPWGAILAGGATNPITGKIDGTKIAKASISGEQIVTNTITASHLSDGFQITSNQIVAATIGSDKLAPGSVGSNQLAKAAITASQIASNSITHVLLAPRHFDTTNHPVEIGDIAISSSSGTYSTASTVFQDVPGLTVRLKTNGRPVSLTFRPSSGDDLSRNFLSSAQTIGYVRFLRNGSPIFTYKFGSSALLILPASSIGTLAEAPVGEWVFNVQAAVETSGTDGLSIRNVQLVAYEL